MNLPNELTGHIKDHLDEVRKYLGALPADERQEILQSIESHIYDALQSRSDAEPTSALLDAVIAEMDPPESYGELPSAPQKNHSRRWRIVIPLLILAALAVIGIKWRATQPFDLSGRWATFDFVSSIEQFDPDTIAWTNDFTLTDLTFLPEGKTDKPQWTWEKGILHHSGDNTDAKLILKKINGEECLFLEWVSGDVTVRGRSPKYYVLKRSSTEPVNGEYALDCEFRALRIAEIIKKDNPDINISSTAEQIAKQEEQKKEVISINYPDYTRTYKGRGKTTPETKTYKLRKTGKESYLLVIEREEERVEIHFKYNAVEQSLTSQTYKYIKKEQPMKPLLTTAVSILAATNLIAGETQAEFDLQEAIDNASSGATVTIPEGTYTQPVTIDKSITLDGKGAVLTVEANRPAVQVDTSRPVSLKNLTIRQRAKTKPQQGDRPYAVYTDGGNLTIEDCSFQALGNSSASPCAVLATGQSTLRISNCRFDGFEYTVQILEGSEGTVEDCLFINPGHCGFTVNRAFGTLRSSIITGSRFHAVRCTSGQITAVGNLIIQNKSRGFYIGNRSSLGKITNNLILENGIGIHVFANSKLEILNNIILGSNYIGLAIIDTAKLKIENNVVSGSEKGLVGFSAQKGKEPSITLRGKNLVHANTVQSEKVELPSKTIDTDPQLEDPDSGLFALGTTKAKGMGLSNPAGMQLLWNKWQEATSR